MHSKILILVISRYWDKVYAFPLYTSLSFLKSLQWTYIFLNQRKICVSICMYIYRYVYLCIVTYILVYVDIYVIIYADRSSK